MEKIEAFGDTFLGAVIAIILLILLFNGDPDISDAVRKIALDYAGIGK